jgi:hypothetical protein
MLLVQQLERRNPALPNSSVLVHSTQQPAGSSANDARAQLQ